MKNFISKAALFIGLLIIIISIASSVEAVNVLANPGFESGTLPWTFYTNGAGSYTITTDAAEGVNAAKITLTNPGTNTQFNQKGFTLKPNTQYTIKFKAKSSTGRDVQVLLHNDVSPFTSYGLSQTFDLTTSYNTFTKDFTTPANVNTPRLRLWFIGLASSNDIYYFDAFELDETPPNNNITISNVKVSASYDSAQINWTTNKISNSVVEHGLTNAYTANVTDASEVTAHSITLSGLAENTTYYYRISSSNANASINTSDATFKTTLKPVPPPNNTKIVSDDFNDCSLNPIWEFNNPVGDGSYMINGTNLLITVPQGTNHDIWTSGNRAPRIMQGINNSDFEIEAKFESRVFNRSQLQGVLIEQDATNFLRIDFEHNGSSNVLFIARFLNNTPTVLVNTVVSQDEKYIRINRIGENWKVYTSVNGTSWTSRTEFSYSITTIKAGVFAGNAGLNPAHTASVDYFFNNNNRIIPEDSKINTRTLTTNILGQGAVIRIPSKSAYACNEQVTLTASPDQGYAFSQWGGNLSGSLNPVSIVMDVNKSVTAEFTQTNSTSNISSNIRSDDFNYCILNPSWTFINPVGDGLYALNGTVLSITVPQGKNHDIWNVSNNASRLMQNINNANFEIEAKFESQVSQRNQLQGILIEQDANNFLRIDFFHDGMSTRIFVAKFVSMAQTVINSTAVPDDFRYLRVNRTGNAWNISYSNDGIAWNSIQSFNHAMITAKAGVYAGNAGPNPTHTAIVDYFFNTESRIIPEDNKSTTKTLATSRILLGDAQGTISITPDKQLYSCNEKVNLTATPSNRSFFNKWSGSINTTLNPVEIVMDADKNITATFGQIGSYKIYREYSAVIKQNTKDWRVTDPAATATGSPNNTPATYLPNSILKINIFDLDRAARAEAIIDLWGGHIGTSNKRFRFNTNSWIQVPELSTTASSNPECFVNQWNPVIDLPLSNLQTGINNFEGTSGPQKCYSYNWGQWGWYGMIVRVYYDDSKPHPIGQIISHTDGQTITDNPIITINASSPAGIKRVELLAYYDGYDEDGDGIYQDYHKSYHRGPSDTAIVLKDIAGSDTTAPYSILWNTTWVPDQLPGSIKLKALITDNNGIVYETDPIEGMTLQRDSVSVKLYKAFNLKDNFIVRANKTITSTFTIPLKDRLNNAQEAQLHITTWNGNDGGINPATETQYTMLNNYKITSIYGADHFYKYNTLTLPKWSFPNSLKYGDNDILFYSGSTKHGKEILWPGPALAVRYSKPVYQQINSGNFEFDITLNASGYARKDTPAEVFIDMSAMLAKLGKKGAVNKDSIMIHEIDNTGSIIDDYVPFQFDADIDYDPTEFAAGNLVVMMKGRTASNAFRYYRAYFNINGSSSILSFPASVHVSDSYDEGQDSFMINTTRAIYQYHKSGAGFSSMIDNQGNDWISYNLAPGAAGAYRGIPNALPPVANTTTPDGLFHPGHTNSVSSLISSGPIRTVIESTSNDGRWKSRWEFYPEFARMEMLRNYDNYWFLYEGTPGGSFEANRDYMVIQGNVVRNANQTWNGDIPGDWLYFADTTVNKALFLAHNTDDNIVDSYYPLNDSMTVFGFGRASAGVKTYIPSKQEFSIGILDTKSYNDVRDHTFSVAKPINNITGSLRSSTYIYKQLVISDDFNTCSLNNGLWQFINPLGDSSYSMNGENILINIPSGTSHDVLPSNINAPRVMQNISNPNFDIIVKFDSNASEMTQIQGILAEQDARNFVKLNVYHNGTTTMISAARSVSNVLTILANSEISVQPNHLRIIRTGTNWELRYSSDGISWSTLTAFTQSYNISRTGFYAGNSNISNTSEPSPAFTSKIDYFFNANYPIRPEDSESATRTLTTSILPAGKGIISRNPERNAYACNEPVTLTAVPTDGWFFNKWSGDANTIVNPITIVMDNDKNITASFVDNQSQVDNIAIGNISVNASTIVAVISWNTDKPSNSIVHYGLNETYTSSIIDNTEVLSHTVRISGLAHNTTYHYKIVSTSQNESGDTDDATFNTSESSIISDDFNYCTLGSIWNFVNPVGDGYYSVNGTHLIITVPNITDHDIWAAGNRAPRIVQNIKNTDFEIEAKFENPVSQKHQLQGILVEQNTNIFIRTDFVNNGTKTMLFIATFTNGARKAINNTPVPDASRYLRIIRIGNNWQVSHSVNGDVWTATPAFNYTMITTKAGVYAGNSNSTGPSNGFDSVIDYFFNTQSRINPEDNKSISRKLDTSIIGSGTISITPEKTAYSCSEPVDLTANPADGWSFNKWNGDINTTSNPISIIMNADKNITATFQYNITISNISVSSTAGSAQIRWVTDKASNSVVLYGLSALYTANITDPTEVTSHTINIPALDANTSYNYKIISSNQNGNASTDNQIFTTKVQTNESDPNMSSGIVSDDFNACSINNSLWTFINPVGDGYYSVNGTALSITVPQGKNHDVWTSGNKAARMMQGTNNSDFEIEAKFESTVIRRNQLQGILVEQDAANFIRADYYSNGTASMFFVASFTNNVPTTRINTPLNETFIRVNRTGNNWKVYTSNNGDDWTLRADFSHALITGKVGVFAGNAGSNPAHTAIIDYFFNNQQRIGPEDAQSASKTLTTNIIGQGLIMKNPDKTAYACNEQVALTASPAENYEFYQWTGSANTVNNPIVLVMDQDKSITAVFNQTIQINDTESDIASDDFNACSINNSLWTFINPVGDGSYTINGTNLLITVPHGISHDIWTTGNNAARLMQNINNANFEIETRFDSQVTKKFQMQGILIEQDANNLLRMEYYSNGLTKQLFVAKLVNGTATTLTDTAVPSDSQYIRINRSMNIWTVYHSADGTTWTMMPEFSHSMKTKRAGIYAGNAGINTPAHTASIDYFFNNQQRISPEDNNSVPAYTLATSIIGLGSLEATAFKDTYACNEPVTLTASPAEDYSFTGWAGDITGAENPVIIIMDNNKAVTAVFNLTIHDTQLSSDDFNTCSFNNSLWTFINPVGDGYYSVNGTNLLITVPQGTDHDVWTSGNKAARVMQYINNSDFEIETRFESLLTQKFQMQGMLIEHDASNFIRTDYYSDGKVVRLFVAIFTSNTSPIIRYNSVVNESYIRINRTGDNWKIYSSGNGNAWTLRADFNHTLNAKKAGVFSGNAGTNPMHTAIIDYFFNNQYRIDPEDANAAPTYSLTTNIIGQGLILKDPDRISYLCNEQVTLSAMPGANHTFESWTGDITGAITPASIIMDKNKSVTAIFNQTINNTINITEPGDVASDDFNTCALNNSLWTFINPLGDGLYLVNGTNLLITVPQGTDHDIWTDGNNAARIMQDVVDEDFEVETKFESQLTQKHQLQGVIVEQNANNFMRADFVYDGLNTKIFIASFTNGTVKIINSTAVAADSQYLRINRTGNSWTISYSADGVVWGDLPSFTYPMVANRVGVYAGNRRTGTAANSPADAPAHTAIIDYFFNNQHRIEPEDANAVPTYNLTTNTQGQGTVDVTPVKQSYSCNELVTLTANAEDSYSLKNWSTGSTANPLIIYMDGNKEITAYFVPSTTNIAVWYGDNQTFGDRGTPQKWVNILGNVNDPSGITSLKYKLNTNPVKSLSIGPDFRRLANSGDYNIDINISELNTGSNKLLIYVTNGNNETTVKSVTVNYYDYNTWSLPYTVNWSSVSNILEASQPVDGKWQVTSAGVKILEPSYDRLLAIGDVDWTDYEVTVPITIHGFNNAGFSQPLSGNGAGIGVLMRWNGHTDNPVSGWQPKSGWKPLGAIAWWWWRNPASATLQLYRSDGSLMSSIVSTPQHNITYMMKIRVETQGNNATYYIKTWKANESEPGWLASGVTVNDVGHGSFNLLAHHVSATFGDVTVTPITDGGLPAAPTGLQTTGISKNSNMEIISVANVIPNSNFHSVVN